MARLAAPLMLAASALVAQPAPGRPGATFAYEAADGTFSILFPLPKAKVQPAQISGSGAYVVLLGDDGETQYGVGVYDFNGSQMMPPSLLQDWTRPAALGFATSAVRTDSIVRLGALVGRGGRIEGENNSGPPFTPGGHRVQVYRVFLVGQRLFHVWAASEHGRALPPEAAAFIESLKIHCDASRPCGGVKTPPGGAESP